MDGFNLYYIKKEIEKNMLKGRVSKLSLPFSDMLLMQIRQDGENKKLLFAMNPNLTRLHLSDRGFENPKQAPPALMLFRKHLSGAELVEVEQKNCDRVIRFKFSGLNELKDVQEIYLYYEATGKHTNLSLVIDGKIIECLRHVNSSMSRLRVMLPGLSFIEPPIQEKMHIFEASENEIEEKYAYNEEYLYKALSKSFCGLSETSAKELAFRIAGFEEAGNIKKGAGVLVKKAINEIEFAPHIVYDTEDMPKQAFPFEYRSLSFPVKRSFESFSSALEEFYHRRDFKDRMMQKSAALIKNLKHLVQRAEKRIAISLESQIEDEKLQEMRVKGELITAYISQIKKGAKEAQVFNYYTSQNITIELDDKKSPQQNAQSFFKQYKKANTAKQLAAEQKESAKAEIEKIDEALYFISVAQNQEDIEQIQEELSKSGILKQKTRQLKQKQAKSSPQKYTMPSGNIVYVGKNSRQNEELLRQARSNDLWLHAKDVPGSHVIIRGESISDDEISFALKLAAYYSRQEGRGVEVDYTKRAYVKKIQGADMGKVTFTNNRTALIKTSLEDINSYIESKGIKTDL